jgi:YidC/Oxa1 family membrane protein insertase
MKEFRNPSQESSSAARTLILIAAASMFAGLQLFFAVHRTVTASPHPQQAQIEVVKPANRAEPGSMNILERNLFVALAFVRTHIIPGWSGSWGWSIVLLTTAINLLLLPLRIASLRSGLKLQRIQPQMEAIKARYKNVKLTDPRHNDLNAEIAKLQKDNGVNPFGGCLPLLVQMPLLFAFFGMLRKASALRGAEWLWLHDLSAVDPYHILPALMVIFQMLVQWYTPSPGSDAKQQRVVAILMTVGFGYVSWHYASGLALYALTGSLISIATQAAINLSPLGREMNALRV